MIRQWHAAASAISLILFLALIVLAIESFRRDIAWQFHDRDGGLWEASVRAGVFTVENHTSMVIRDLIACAAEYEVRSERASRLRAEWQRRPNRFVKSKDDLVDRLVKAEAQLQESSDRSFMLQQALNPRRSPPPVRHLIRIPLALATLALPSGWCLWAVLGRIRRAKRRHAGLCAACGYDVRASADRCPECGTPIPAQTTA